MQPHDLAKRALARIGTGSIEERLSIFLSNPANLKTSRGRRILELLERARERKAQHEQQQR